MNQNGNATAPVSLIRANRLAAKSDATVVVGPKQNCSLPEVNLHGESGGKQTIEIKCKCGETIFLECSYE